MQKNLAYIGLALLAAAMGWLIPAVHPVVPFAIVLGLLAGALIFSSPFTLLCAFILVLCTRPAEFFPQLAVLQMGKIFSLGGVALWLLSKVLKQDTSWAASKHNFWLIWLTVAVFISSQLGTDRGASMATFNDVFVKILILYVLIMNVVDTPTRAYHFQMVLVGACAFLGGYGVQAQIMGTATIEGSRAALVGYLGDPNDMAMTLLVVAPFVMQGVVSARGKNRVVFLGLALLVIGGLLSTQSRGGLLGISGAGYFVMRDKIKSRIVIGAMIGACLLGAVVASGMSSRSSGGVGHGEVDESAQGRLDAWSAGGRMVMARPIFGVGFSRFADNYEAYVINPVIWGKHETHNAYIKCASETGITGFIGYIALILRSLLVTFRLRRELSERDPRLEVITARAHFGNLVSVCISSFFLSACWSWFIYIIVAQAAALERCWELVEVSEDGIAQLDP